MSTINWKTVREFEDITYKKCDGVARIAFNRPDVRNAFRPKTTKELIEAFYDAQEDTSIGVVLLSAEGPSSKDGIWSFCSGGDQKARGHQGYVGEDGYHRLNILEVQRMIRFMPKAVICVVPGWAVGGGHSLHVVCDLTLASKEHAIFKQTDADVTSFDGGYGSAYLAKMVGLVGGHAAAIQARPDRGQHRTVLRLGPPQLSAAAGHAAPRGHQPRQPQHLP
jgi:naphthoate synthase